MRSIDFSDGFSSASAPTQGSIQQNSLASYASDAAFVAAKGSAATNGDAYYNTSTDYLRAYINGAWMNLVAEARPAAISTGTSTPLTLTGGGVGVGGRILFNQVAASGYYNFQVASGYNTASAFEITPSTAVDGSTFSTPSIKIPGANGNVILKGTPTNDDAPTGYVGEIVQSLVSATVNFPASGSWGDVTSVSLTAGDWEVDMCVEVGNFTVVSPSGLELGISTTSGNSSAGMNYGILKFQHIWTATAGWDVSYTLRRIRFSLNATTTVYGKILGNYSSGNPKYLGALTARRVR